MITEDAVQKWQIYTVPQTPGVTDEQQAQDTGIRDKRTLFAVLQSVRTVQWGAYSVIMAV